MGIATKCAHHHIHQGNARQVYREYLWYKDRFKEFPRVLYRSPYIKLDRNRIINDSCIQSNLEKTIIDKLLLTIDEFLNDCERDAIEIKQSHEELKRYLIAENIRKAEKEALQEKKKARASQRSKSSSRNKNINLLRQIGYETSLSSDIRQQILLELALPEFGERVVVENLKLLIEKRKRTTYDEQRLQKSIYALESDIDFIIESKK